MTLVAVVEAAAIVAIVFLLLRQQSERAGAYEKVISQMADRIQHPERPQPAQSIFSWPAEDGEIDESDLVGTIADPDDTVQD